MIFLQNKINSVIEMFLVNNSVGCHVCGKQVKHRRDETEGTNYIEFRNFNLRLVKQFYSNVSIREVKTNTEGHQASGILVENLSTGEVVPVSFSHRYLLRNIKYKKNQDNSHLDIGFDLIRSVMKTLNEEQLQKFLENLFIDANIELRSQLTIKERVIQGLPVSKFEQFDEYVRSHDSSDVQMEVKPMSYSNLDLFSHMEALEKYKNKTLFFLSMKLLSWAKEWTDQNYSNIKRPCVECYLRKLEKTKGWDTGTIETIENVNSLDINEKAKLLSDKRKFIFGQK